jgi:hypothetical protein
MKRNLLKTNRLEEDQRARARAARDKGQAERARLAASFRQSLEAQFRDSIGAPEGALSAAVEALLSAAVSAHIEIRVTTERFLLGRASNKSLHRLGLARSELRRALRSLGLADSGEQRDDPNAPPPGASDEEKREWSRRYVDNLGSKETSAAQ